jgi:hypothetical protein
MASKNVEELVQWCVPVDWATPEAETGGSPEPRSSGPTWTRQLVSALKIMWRREGKLSFFFLGGFPLEVFMKMVGV